VTTFTLDSNCLVAAALESHVHHLDTVEAIEKLDSQGAEAALVGHALLEAYAVLTRLPGVDRLAPAATVAILQPWLDRTIAPATGEDALELLRRAARAGVPVAGCTI
jgi:predicted nucleic acid-binding protein